MYSRICAAYASIALQNSYENVRKARKKIEKYIYEKRNAICNVRDDTDESSGKVAREQQLTDQRDRVGIHSSCAPSLYT